MIRTRICGAAVLAAAISLAVPAASAHAQRQPPLGGTVGHCFWLDHDCIGEARFEWDGDDQWVIDGRANGWGVGAKIQTDYGKVRWCTSFLGKDVWHECRFNHKEYRCVRWRMYEIKGERVRYGSPAWSHWYHTTSGAQMPSYNCP
jgi:hypothetical protein